MPAAVIETAVPDLRAFPLGAIPDDVLGNALRRLLGAPLAGQVPVAAFTSSI
jgi:FXSXX-COOH protein